MILLFVFVILSSAGTLCRPVGRRPSSTL